MDTTLRTDSYIAGIDWSDRLKDLKPSWYHREEIIKALANKILVCAGVIAITVVVTAFSLTAISARVMKIIFFSVITSSALAALGITMRSSTDFWKDPGFCRREGEKVLKELAGSTMSNKEIKEKFGFLIDKKILKDEDINYYQMTRLISQEESQKISYEQYREENGVESLKLVPEAFKTQIQKEFLKHIENEEKNLVSLLKIYQKDIEFLDVKEETRKQIIPAKLKTLNEDYLEFRINTGWENIRQFLEFNSKEEQGTIKQIKDLFCELPYLSMKDDDYKDDRIAFEISPKTIQNAVWKDFNEMDYEHWAYKHKGFSADLEDGDSKKCVQDKFISFLKENSSLTIFEYLSEGNVLGVSMKDILAERWNPKNVMDILNDENEKEAFCKAIENEMVDKSIWRDKILLEITSLSIEDILKKLDPLLSYRIVGSHDLQKYVKDYLKKKSICSYPWEDPCWKILNTYYLVAKEELELIEKFQKSDGKLIHKDLIDKEFIDKEFIDKEFIDCLN